VNFAALQCGIVLMVSLTSGSLCCGLHKKKHPALDKDPEKNVGY